MRDYLLQRGEKAGRSIAGMRLPSNASYNTWLPGYEGRVEQLPGLHPRGRVQPKAVWRQQFARLPQLQRLDGFPDAANHQRTAPFRMHLPGTCGWTKLRPGTGV